MTYESPAKKQIREGLAKMGRHASPKLRALVEAALPKIDDTDPKTVLVKLPPPVVRFYQECGQRGIALTAWAGRAYDGGFHIENSVVCHGIIQYALRGLYVLAWQRSLDRPLSEEDLRAFWDPNDHRASVDRLLTVLIASDLLNEPQGPFLRDMNSARNKAAHGLVFGEVPIGEVASYSDRIRHAAVGALGRMSGWLTNPRPLLRTLEEEASLRKKRGASKGP